MVMQPWPMNVSLFANDRTRAGVVSSPVWVEWFQKLSSLGLSSHPWIDVVADCGADPSGVADSTPAFQAGFILAQNNLLLIPQGAYRITQKVSFALAGSISILGLGAAFNSTAIPTAPYGSVIIWDGDPADTMFEFGGGPLYINGVWQASTTWQNNVSLYGFTIHANKGAQSLVYVHDQDNFSAEKVFVNGFQQDTLRGVFDLRGTCSNFAFKGVTVFEATRAYAFRCGDGFVNSKFDRCCCQKTPMGYWFSDCHNYEKPWPDGITEWQDCTFEGTVIQGQQSEPKWKVDAINGSFAAGVSVITVAHGALFAIGDDVFMGRGPDKFEMNYVTNVSGNNLTLKFPTDYAHSTTEMIKAGSIGIHCGSGQGMTTTLMNRHCMYNWVGCGIDAHDLSNITIDTAIVPGGIKRLLLLDGDVNNIYLLNPDIWPKTYTDYKIWEITDRGNVFDFNWYGKPDRSGQTEPYLNAQGEGDFNYIGSFQQTSGASSLPPGFRGLTFDSIGGITVEEGGPRTSGTLAEIFAGLNYKTQVLKNHLSSPPGTVDKRTTFSVHPFNGIHYKGVTPDRAEIDVLAVDPFVGLTLNSWIDDGITYTGNTIQTLRVNPYEEFLFKTLVYDTVNSVWVEVETLRADPYQGLIFKVWNPTDGFKTALTLSSYGQIDLPFGFGVYVKTMQPNGTLAPFVRNVMGSAALVAGTATVTLTGNAIFTGQYTYVVLWSRTGSTNGLQIYNNSNASFTMVSSVLTDTDTVSYVAVGS
jgi:hypothetical protein